MLFLSAHRLAKLKNIYYILPQEINFERQIKVVQKVEATDPNPLIASRFPTYSTDEQNVSN